MENYGYNYITITPTSGVISYGPLLITGDFGKPLCGRWWLSWLWLPGEEIHLRSFSSSKMTSEKVFEDSLMAFFDVTFFFAHLVCQKRHFSTTEKDRVVFFSGFCLP